MAKIKKILLPDNEVRDIADAGAIRFDSEQTLSDDQKIRAKANLGIGAMPVFNVNEDGSVSVTFD